MPLLVALALALSSVAFAQRYTAASAAGDRKPVEFKEEKLYGRNAYVLDNGVFRIAVLRGGGHIAEVRLVSKDPLVNINPMRVPHYPTIEPYEYEPSKHDAIYGSDPHRWLSSGYMGHLLCFPFYGAPSAEEAKAGLGNHGEAPIVEWRILSVDRASDGSIRLRYGADLPKTQFRVERVVTLHPGDQFAHVEEWVENLTPYDRPINWMQHATFGPPFVEPGKTFLDVSATRGLTAGGRPQSASLRPDNEVNWPNGTAWDGAATDLRAFQSRPNAGTYCALLLDPKRPRQFFTMYHSGHRIAIGYFFPSAGGPWIADWQENNSNRNLPWNGQVVARGIEWGTSPFAEGLRRSVERGKLFETPSFRWIGGRERLKTEFRVFVIQVPEGFQGVRDVVVENGALVAIAR
jgi:hypothetical protein